MKFIWLLLSACSAMSAQDAPHLEGSRLTEARELAKKLTGNVAIDGPFLSAPHAAELFRELMIPGQSKSATHEQLADLHLALNGLVQIEVSQGHLLKASVYEAFHETYYRMEQNYESALAASRRALALSVQSGELSNLWLEHMNIGHNLMSLARPAEALEEFGRAEPILPSPSDKNAGLLGREWVQALLAMKRTAEAEAQLKKMEAVAPDASPLFRCRTAFARSDLLFAESKFRPGVAAVKAALASVPPGPDYDSVALEANLQLLTGVLDGVRVLPYDQAIQMAHDAEGEIPGLTVPLQPFARSLIRRRRLLSGDIEGVLREDAERLETARAAGNVFGQVEALQSLAASYSAVNGRREQATLLEEALRVEKPSLGASGIPADAGSQLSYYRTLDSLGWSYLAQSQIGAARRAFDEMLKGIASYVDVSTRDRLRDLRSSAVLGKARVAELSDEPEDARSLLLGELNTAKGSRSDVLLQLARLERSVDEKPALAAEYYEQGIRALLMEKYIAAATATRLSYARYLLTKAPRRLPDAADRAKIQLAAVEQVLPTLNYAEGEWRLSYLKGILLEAQNPKSAIESYTAAIERLDRIRSSIAQQDLRQGLLDDDSIADLYRRQVALLTRTGQHDLAWQYMERAKARTFLDAMGGRQFAAPVQEQGRDNQLAALTDLEHRLDSLRLELAGGNAQILRGAGHEPAFLAAELKELEAQYTLARQQSALRNSRAGHVLSTNPASLTETQKRVPAGVALIEYGLLEGELTAFVITSTSTKQLSWAAETELLRRNTLRFRRSAANPDSTDLPALIEYLSKTLMAPLADVIPPGIQQLLIIPSSYLNYIPFSLLLLPEGKSVLDRFAVGYLPSAGALQYLHPRKPGLAGLFLGALGNQAADGMPPLPGTIAETEGIRRVYPAAKLVSGPAFTHDAAKTALLTNTHVHFATHGLVDEESPLFSALLTGPSSNAPSRLSLYEITTLPLRASTVVLSACETAIGKMSGGDEISGLTRTFLIAGADTVVSSLWKVSDESTALLMSDFYRRLNQGAAPARALRDAALQVRKAYPHPFYWAPFIVIGVN